ncbi:VWD domain-containing protein [Argonema antarcticum]|uniref:VWD domain-containing protein n=1 Tax=Argonema antarcticum TaxID=2942763 RepID=UPI0020135F05|nr:VWD domain-containing protein [Argonema antarcticum]MCL1471938.1 VWD domain-containing protein [Argonema antarcticum A004/B2]
MQSLTNYASFGTLNPELLDVELSDELKNAQNYLRSLATSPDFVTKMQVAFGNGFDLQKVEELAASWGKGDFGNFPQIEMRDAAEINGARGAFAAATNTIYLSREFAIESEGNVDAIASVLLEEYGHYIDSQINAIDAAGDEGEIFAALAQGKVLNESELAALKGEDDSAIVVLDGEEVRIEQAEMTSQTDKLNFFAGKIGNWGGGSSGLEEDLFKPIEISAPGGTVDNLFAKFDWDLKSELKGSVFVTPGNFGEAKFSYPIDVAVELPKEVDLGETFSIIPGVGVKNSAAEFDSQGTKGFELPNAGFKIEANLRKATLKDLTIKNPFGHPFQPDIAIESSGGQAELSFDVIKYPEGGFEFPGGIGSITASIPKIEDGEIQPTAARDSSDPLLPDIAASGKSNNIINLEGDLDKIFALSFPALRVLGNEVEASLPEERIKAKLSYDLLDIKANIGLGLQQDFTFDPDRAEVTMSVDGQSEQNGVLGNQNNKFEFKAPSQGSGLVKVKAKYELFGNVKNNIGSVFQGGIDVSALQAGGSFEIGNLSGSSQFGPLLSLKIPEGGFATDPLPLIGSPPTKPSDFDPKFKILKTINTKEVEGTELDDKNPDQNASKNLIVEVEYEIPYNLPFSISDARATEGDNLVFTVSRREPSNQAVNLIVEYENGNATAGEDYSPSQRTVTIPGGQVSADITVPTTGDNKQESTETFKVKLKKPDGSSFATNDPVTTIDATGIIIDDDQKPDRPKDGGKTYNDPRIVTLDKQYHDFQAVGEFVLVESTSGDLKIQVRQQPLGSDRLGSVSENTAVATVLAGQRIGIYRDRGLLINGNPTTIANNDSLIIGDGRIYREGGQYTIVYGTGDQLVASVSNRVNVSFFAKEERQGQIKGLLGNFNRDPKDDLTKRDGTVLTPPVTLSQLYNEYADSWRINQAESLFDYKPSENTNTFTNRNFPRKKVTLRDLDPTDIRRAEQVIGDRISNPIVREAAIIDYILTGFDESIIEEAIASLTPESVLAIAIPTQAVDDFTATTVNTPIRLDVTSNDDRTIGVPISIFNFDQTSTAGSIIRLDDNSTPDDKTDDQLIYTPTANFTGNDTFNYTVTDGTQTSTAKVTVNIAAFNLSNLNGSNGFTLNGINAGNFAGVSVNTLGDFNGDGFHDFIIGAFAADPNNNNAAGETYVVFGKKGGFPASIDLPKLDGSNGFILNGIDTNGFSGGSVSSAGDINGDGLDDLVIGAFGATANGQNNAGKSYVVFGSKAVLPARLNLSDLNGNNGFVVNGINEFDYLGLSVSGAGDINADGIDDLLMSAPGPLNGTLSKSYVMYGHKGNFAANLNSSDINGSNGFVINDNDGKSGTSVSAAGDINGDRIDDIIINAEENDSNNYVVFGSAKGFPANFNLSELNGSNGFILDTLNEKSGTTVSKAGDINGDTIDDLIISLASSNSNIGKTYILFGNNRGFAPRFDVSQFNGRNGFAVINNIDGNSISAVSGAGDINGDGIDDLAIATSQANANAGKTYILFGDNAGFTPTFYLSKINGTNGLVINGIKEDDLSGTSLSQGGDINGDNIDDLVIGSPGNLFKNSPGQTHVVFGNTLFGSSKDTSNLAKLLFDSRYYSNQNPDVRSAVSNGLFHNAFEHFVKFGLNEGREPSATFAGDYLTNNPDVAAAVNTGIFHSGFEHFIKAGLAEGRQPDSILGSLASLEVFYRSENPDVVQAIQQEILSSGLEHLIRFGMFEERPPFTRFNALSETFNSDFYLAQNQDVKQAVDADIIGSGFEHFVNFGLLEGRDPSSQFSNSSYLANYPDIAGAVSNGIFRSGYEHFMKYGFGEDRVGVETSFR